ncbi:type II CRISPR-associated endonuclease Cas1 [Zavarzinia compransoris]|uniref:CRISPR-associated endonuclease Cas1 n=1 Tax=Zavarzinia compransoris TaxID=1264899 RepID=A0A317EF52_9PROT|nr:type II CRISPR-associated endonuclease Cas1 [Zavarzinia compransoris]PWR23805.1 type II CRISPR-associated endonuclease Cas1 [Zavarzinia compransoris]TDP48036.1 CRISPR-associated Cas1 family protein [Zavarzinia compransoris]
MVGRVIDIATDGRHVALNRGFLVVSDGGAEVGRVAVDGIAALVTNAHGLTFTNNVLVELSRRGIPVVLCGPNHRPEAIVWPVDGHHQQSGRMADQIAASTPLKKRLWAQIVRAKILAQGATLAAVGARHAGFQLLSRKVRSGDPDNVEAEAARRYWPLLFGPEFRRDRDDPGINGLLNYGYAVLRAGVARAVMAGGLHPGIGLMHANRGNPMVLVDDLMEPFRPAVDLEVWRLVREGAAGVDTAAKTALARAMVLDLPTAQGLSPVMTCAERLVASLARAHAGEGEDLALPLPRLPLEG